MHGAQTGLLVEGSVCPPFRPLSHKRRRSVFGQGEPLSSRQLPLFFPDTRELEAPARLQASPRRLRFLMINMCLDGMMYASFSPRSSRRFCCCPRKLFLVRIGRDWKMPNVNELLPERTA